MLLDQVSCKPKRYKLQLYRGRGKISFMDSNDEGVKESKLELLATASFPDNPVLVYVVDFLNRNLKKKNIMFGIKKNKENNEMIINIYEV